MVAAYLIGSAIFPVPQSYFASMSDITACSDATDLGCVIHWDTFGDGGSKEGGAGEEPSLCTNPLTWTTDEEMASADLNQGAVAITVPYNVDFAEENAALGVVFDALEAPVAKHTWAQCRNGVLFVADQAGTMFDAMATLVARRVTTAWIMRCSIWTFAIMPKREWKSIFRR